jgi:hypothetical protein
MSASFNLTCTDDWSSKDEMRLHDLTAGTSLIHLEPSPRLLDVFLPSLRESNQLCTLELDGLAWVPPLIALKKTVTYHAMITTPPHGNS